MNDHRRGFLRFLGVLPVLPVLSAVKSLSMPEEYIYYAGGITWIDEIANGMVRRAYVGDKSSIDALRHYLDGMQEPYKSLLSGKQFNPTEEM